MTCDGFEIPPHEVDFLICVDIEKDPDENVNESHRASYCSNCYKCWELEWYIPRFGLVIV